MAGAASPGKNHTATLQRLLDSVTATIKIFPADHVPLFEQWPETFERAALLAAFGSLLQKDARALAGLKPYLLSVAPRFGDEDTTANSHLVNDISNLARDGTIINADSKYAEILASLRAKILAPGLSLFTAPTTSTDLADVALPDLSTANLDADTAEGPDHSADPADVPADIVPPFEIPANALDPDPFADSEFDFMAIARRAAQSALNPGSDETQQESSAVDRPTESRSQAPSGPARTPAMRDMPSRPGPPPTQTASTRLTTAGGRNGSFIEEYERVRAFAAQRDQSKRHNVASSSSRRVWTTAEEDALMQGLDDLQGPHWTQILARYGENGTMSSVLAGRTQVQLKDKARNLKLYFLKNNQPLPKSLTHVTGDLKTRAPMHLLRDEAEQQHRSSEEI